MRNIMKRVRGEKQHQQQIQCPRNITAKMCESSNMMMEAGGVESHAAGTMTQRRKHLQDSQSITELHFKATTKRMTSQTFAVKACKRLCLNCNVSSGCSVTYLARFQNTFINFLTVSVLLLPQQSR